MGRHYCNCFHCTGYTKDLLIDLKEKIADREIKQGIEEYNNRFTDQLELEEAMSDIEY